MSVSLVEKEGLSRELTIDVPAQKLAELIETRVKEVAQKANLPGFRSDKPVPLRAVKQKFGKDIRQESTSQLMIQEFLTAIESQKIEPAGDPVFEELLTTNSDQFRFKATFEVVPQIQLKSLDGTSVDKIEVTVTDEDVEKTVLHLRQQNRNWSPVDRPAADGDRVSIDFKGTVDGEVLESGNAENYEVEIGSNMMIPGFEEGLVGRQPGDEFELSLTFPEDYHHQKVAGQAVEFKVKLHKIEAGELPEIDAAFCEKFQIEGGPEALNDTVKKNLTNQAEDVVKNKNKDAILTKFLEQNPIEVPTVMVDGEIKRRMQQSSEMAQFTAQPEQMAAIGELMRPEVTRAVQVGLLLRQFIQEQSLTVNDDEVRGRVETLAKNYQTPDEYIEWFYTDKNRSGELKSAIIEDKAIDLLYKQTNVTIKPMSYNELTTQK